MIFKGHNCWSAETAVGDLCNIGIKVVLDICISNQIIPQSDHITVVVMFLKMTFYMVKFS